MMCRKKKIRIAVMAFIIALIYSGFAFGTVTNEEAAKLGTTLTPFGAEKAGNADGTIPPYTGGLTTPPPNFVPGSGWRPDPFASESPLFSINARNMAEYADRLTEGTKFLIRKYPNSFRMDVYKSHRSVAYPDWVLKNTVANATKSTTGDGGLSLENARNCIPFPIPKNGYEVMWNHLVAFQGVNWEGYNAYTDLVDPTGRIYNLCSIHTWYEWPYWERDLNLQGTFKNSYWKNKWLFTGPPRKAGEGGLAIDPLNIAIEDRKAWIYLTGQRRVKLAPQVQFDTPSTDGNGHLTYDETWLFNGSMERYNWKLLGKKEMYIPYNAYKVCYTEKTSDPNIYNLYHLNPDVVRWELHRVWVVEATLKPGKRHIYKTRRFYVDEDTWRALAAEFYDAADKMYKVDYMFYSQSYDQLAPVTYTFAVYNVNAGLYVLLYPVPKNGHGGKMKKMPDSWWSPDNIAAGGVR